MPKSQQPEEGEQLIIESIEQQDMPRILDVGAGEGKWFDAIKSSNTEAICMDGVEIFKPNAEKLLVNNKYDTVINDDVTKLTDEQLAKYNTFILGDVLEHIHYDDAVEFIERLKKQNSKIYLTIPISTCIQGPVGGNVHETHVYQWSDEELTELGFKQIHKGTNPNGLVWIGTYVMN